MQTETIHMKLNTWRGYSAYEIAVQNGFEGSQSEWLQSLKGADGESVTDWTVNNKAPVDGNITLRAGDIPLQPGLAATVGDALENVLTTEKIADSLDVDDPAMALSAAQGRVLYRLAAPKAQAAAYLVALPADGWTQQDELYAQTVSAPGATADVNLTSVLVSPPTDRTLEETYLACAVRAASQGDGTLTFTCTDLPDADLEAVVTVITLGVTNHDP